MNIPKPAIWAGLVAMVGVYMFTRIHGDPPVEPAGDDDDHAHEQAAAPGGSGAHPNQPGGRSQPAAPAGPSKIQITDVKVGTGAVATEGKSLSMHYRGTLLNGKQFDSSYDKGQPFNFVLGAGQVIKGWDQGIKGMKVGGKRKLVIPSDLAYGAQSPSPDIPANSTLQFDVELLGVK